MEDVLTDALRQRIDQLIGADRIVLFMKGQRAAPQCGFSQRVVQILDGLVDHYADVDVLADMTLREGLKSYANWPTFPQLWVDGELVGGCDIVEQLHDTHQLAGMLGVTPATPPSITLTPAAATRIREASGEDAPTLRLRIGPRFRYQFEAAVEAEPGDLTAQSEGITLLVDRASARRADGMTMDFVDNASGAGLVVDNPNEPARVQPLQPEAYARWRSEGRPAHLVDVRTPEEHALASIDGAHLFGPDSQAWLDALPKDAPMVFLCHHGIRSQRAAEHALTLGFTNVYNLEGGIDAWAIRVDPSVGRY